MPADCRMLYRYIQKQDNLKLNACPLQCPRVQPHSACPELRPLWKASPRQPPYQARRIKSVSRLLCSFYKLQIRTVENSGFLANDHRINTPPYKLKKKKKNLRNIFKCLVTPQQSAQSEENPLKSGFNFQKSTPTLKF